MFLQIKTVDVFTIVAKLLIIARSAHVRYTFQLPESSDLLIVATLRKQRQEKAAKFESSEGRYFRNFTVRKKEKIRYFNQRLLKKCLNFITPGYNCQFPFARVDAIFILLHESEIIVGRQDLEQNIITVQLHTFQ